MINERNDNGTKFYDIYLQDTGSIKKLNDYLRNKYNPDNKTWIEINYFADSLVARDYFKKQLDDKISEKEKDRLFKYFIANYKHNPNMQAFRRRLIRLILQRPPPVLPR